jgi:transposase
VHRRAEFYYQQLDALRSLRQEVRRDLLAESKKHKAWKLLCQIPSIGPIRSAVLLGILQTPHRFRTKRQLWAYGGVGIETSSSADHHVVKGQLERKKKQVEIRGLNRNYNHDLKNLFKGAAIVAATKPGPFAEFYTELLARGMRPEMARLTLARKIATIVLIVWKRGVCFDAQHLKPQKRSWAWSWLLRVKFRPPNPRILPSHGDTLIVAAKTDVGSVAIANLNCLMFP